MVRFTKSEPPPKKEEKKDKITKKSYTSAPVVKIEDLSKPKDPISYDQVQNKDDDVREQVKNFVKLHNAALDHDHDQQKEFDKLVEAGAEGISTTLAGASQLFRSEGEKPYGYYSIKHSSKPGARVVSRFALQNIGRYGSKGVQKIGEFAARNSAMMSGTAYTLGYVVPKTIRTVNAVREFMHNEPGSSRFFDGILLNQ